MAQACEELKLPVSLVPRGLGLSEAQVVALAEEVHHELGPGLEPEFYGRALAAQLQMSRLLYRKDCWFEVRFRGASLGRRRLDFLLEDLAVQVMSAPTLRFAEGQRLRVMTRAAGVDLGLLLNFGGPQLAVQRVRPAPRSEGRRAGAGPRRPTAPRP